MRGLCNDRLDGCDPRVTLPPSLTDDVVADLAAPWRELARASAVRRLTLDAGELTDVSARGLGLLVAMSRLARSRGAQVVIVNAPESLHRLLAAARLDYRPGDE